MDFDYNFEDDECWNDEEEPSSFRNDNRGFRNRQYSNAYGDYRGGYGPPSFRPDLPGPPPFFGPPRGMPMMMPRGPPGLGPMGPPTTIFGRGYGSRTPMQRAKGDVPAIIRYLIRCGIPKNNLKNLPRDLLSLIKPQYCGLCGRSFESFQLSRIHYLSRNHQKAQKKWLMPLSNTSSQNPREAPLRARELYCEICDVQITSKVHADSHYDGKSHQAIVQGRKQSKNPILLQPGMERRLAQLIRREKKFLKKPTETEEVKEDIKDVKPIQPELYCDICKTNVTCSEQMTAHLNGKKHLLKEKKYIFKSMSSDIKVPAAKIEVKTENPDIDAEEKNKEEEWQENWE